MEELVNINEWTDGQPLANFTPAQEMTSKDTLHVLQAHKSKSDFLRGLKFNVFSQSKVDLCQEC